MRSRRRLWVVVALAAMLPVVPARAGTPPVIEWAEAFGHRKPLDPGAADPVFGSSSVFPTSLAYGVGEPGQIHVRGNATPGSLVTAVVKDELGSLPVERSTYAASIADGHIAEGDFHIELRVTDLGLHRATGEPGSEDPAEWGRASLIVTVTASDEHGTSEPVELTMTKYAATPHDNLPPILSRVTWPPANWCRAGAAWAGVGDLENGVCKAGRGGIAVVSGTADDAKDPATNGIGSEIADARIEIVQGSTVLRDVSSIYRYGARASWGLSLSVEELPPNWPYGEKYFLRVTVSDAWGHTVVIRSPDITVYPF